MLLSYQELLNYDIPEVRQRYSQRDTILYALSVGLGQDPMDAGQLRYVDEQFGPNVLPSMAVILGYPGFWLNAPEIGADVTRLLHGEQSVKLLASLPHEGEVIGKTRVVEVVDKGDKGLLVYSEKELRDASNGRVLARTSATTVLRGDRGMPGAPTQARVAEQLPDTPPTTTSIVGTRPEQALFYRQNGDRNPLHSDPKVAKLAGYDRPILHGLCSFAMVNHAVSSCLKKTGDGEFDHVFARFSAPVFPGESIQVDVWDDGSFRAKALERDAVVMQGRQHNH